MSVLIVGSIALDTVKTPVEEHADLLGGSASYASLGASFFSPVKLVGIVGDDFPESEFDFWKTTPDRCDRRAAGLGQNISLVGRICLGHEYARDAFGGAQRLRTFPPRFTRGLSRNRFCLARQYRARAPVSRPGPDETAAFCRRRYDGSVDRDDARRSRSAAPAGRFIDSQRQRGAPAHEGNQPDQGRAERSSKAGPKYVAIKKGEHGALLFGEDEFFSCGAYPLEDIHDPTGAGDTFAGGLAGYLASASGKPDFSSLRRAVIYGSVLASFNVEAFSLERLRTLTIEEIEGALRSLPGDELFR